MKTRLKKNNNKKKTKRTLALVLTFMLCLGVLPTGIVAEAAEAPVQEEVAEPAESPAPEVKEVGETPEPEVAKTVESSAKTGEPAAAASETAPVNADAPDDTEAEQPDEQEAYVPDADTVEAIRAAIDALPEAAYVLGLDVEADADELESIYSDFSDVDELLFDAKEELTEEQIEIFEAAIGADRMAKYNALYAYFLNMTAPAVPLGSYAPGTIHLSVETGLPQTATTYNLQTDTTGKYRLRYVPSTAGTDNTVLVVRWMEYGTTLETLPNASAVGINEVIKLGDNSSIAIKLENNLTDDFILDIKLKTAALTQEQAEKWMDNGVTPMPVISVSEYQWPGALAGFTETGTPYNTVNYGSVVPAESDCSIDVTHTYKFDVSSVGPITNYLLNRAGTSMGNPGYICDWNQNGMLRYEIPAIHSNGNNRLLEIKSIKIYCPDEKLELIGLGTTGTGSVSGKKPSFGRDLGSGDFNPKGIWDKTWSVSERKTDSSDQSYYEIRPTTRFFNIGEIQKPNDKFYGVRLIWGLIDENGNGTYEAAEELPYSDTSYTTMQAADTEVTYRCAGDAADRIFTHKGPMIRTFKRENIDVFSHAYGSARLNINIPTNEVIIGGEYVYTANTTDNIFTCTSNAWYINRAGRNNAADDTYKTEYVPTFDGAVTQSFDFPPEISPKKMRISDDSQTSAQTLPAGRETVLGELTYTLADGTTVNATPAEIKKINDLYVTYNKQNKNIATSYPFAKATEDNPVRNVTIKWNSLRTPYCLINPHKAPAYNGIKKINGVNTHSILGGMFTVGIGFDYHVNEFHDLAQTQPIPDEYMAQVNYTLTRDGDSNIESNSEYLWFRLRQPPCPDLYGIAASDRATPKYGDGTSTYSMGNIGFYIDSYGKRADYVQNPVIDLTAKSTKFTGITEAQGLAFLTGEFTAMPKLSGWKIDYTTNKGKAESITVPPITNTKGEPFSIPLDDDDAFTSIKLSYDGMIDLPHTSETDTTKYILLMSGIKLRALNKNPIDGADINTETNFTSGIVELDGVLHTDNCSCPDAKHTQTASNTGQVMVLSASTAPLQRWLYFTRQAVVNFSGAGISKDPNAIYQGDPVVATLTPTVTLAKANPGTSFEGSLFPWGIAEAAYIELPDNEFLPDLSKTTFYGEAANSEHVKAEIKYVGTRRFLKLSFEEGYIRSNVYKATTCDLYVSNSNQYGWTAAPGSFKSSGTNTQLAGPIEIAFSTLSSTSLGFHHPLGEVYLDFSGLLDRYDAPNDTGYDGIPTDYIFTNAVEDTLGLSASAATEKKLFKFDASKFKVEVMLTATFAVAIVPGKQGSIYAFDTRLTQFEASDRKNLNALVVMEVPQSREAHEMTVYVKIPNKAYPVEWEQSGGVTQHSQSRYNMWLLREPIEYSSSGIIGNIKYAYTTDAIPTENSNYTETAPTTEDGWKAVTGVRIICKKLSAESSLNIKFDFAADVKDELGDIYAYTGGTYKYHENAGATEWVTGYLPLATWKYTDQTIKGGVYWDLYDENGLKGTTGNTGVSYEPWAAGVKAQLFSPADELISETQTDADGKFVLQSYTDVAGQYIKLTMPEVPNTKAKPTKESKKVFTTDNLDSDFGRETNRLTLPALPTGGLSNVSAGLVKLPELTIKNDANVVNDVLTVQVGQTVNLTAILKDYLGKSMPADSYNITFEYKKPEDTAIAEVTDKTVIVTGTASTTSKDIRVKGKAVGTITAEIITTNTLGDEVKKTVTINVTTSYSNITVKKVWDDDNNKFRTRPSSVTLQLQRKIPGGTPENVGGPVIVSGTSRTFNNQPVFDNAGKKYEYSVVETNVPLNYEAVYSKDSTGALVVTNKLKTITVSGVKTWDEQGTGWNRPSSIEVTLWRDGVAMKPEAGYDYTETVTAANADPADSKKWNYSFSKKVLQYNPVTEQPYVYTVKETPFTANNPGEAGFNYSAAANGMDVTNMYPAKRFYKVTKTWEHGDLPSALRPTEVTIMLYRDGKLFTGEQTCGGRKILNAENGWTHTFEVMQADAQGHTFSIEESPIPGYTAEIGSMVTDAANNTRVSCEVRNTYTPTPVTYNPSVTKAISGPLPTGATPKEFAFTLTSTKTGQPMPAVASGDTLTATINGIGTLNFGDITFSKAGTYTYKIQETDRSGQPGYDGYSFDTTAYTLTVVVQDVTGDGTLTATPAIKDGADKTLPLTITNTYKPKSTSYTLGVHKALNGDTAVLSDNFKFTLSKNAADSPMPAGSGNMVTINGAGYGTFGGISFSKPGEYTYTIKEEIPADAAKVEGYTYSTETVPVKITVTDVSGQLQATADIANDNIIITNTFTTPKINVTGTIAWDGWASGEPRPGATIKLWQNNPSPTATDIPYATVTVPDGGTSYSFTGLPKYDASGTRYDYTVSEEPITGVDITLAANGWDFTNRRRTPGVITSNELKIIKTITGNPLPEAAEFTFTIARTDTGLAEAVIMPGDLTATTAPIRTGSAPAVGFGDIAFCEAGTYTFAVTENASGIDGMIDDTSQKDVTVEVENNSSSILTATITSPTGGTLTFTNTYPNVTDTDSGIRKEITGDTPDKPETFRFKLKAVSHTPPGGVGVIAPEGMPMPAGSADGEKIINISGGGRVDFGSFTYSQPGVYVYTIQEIAGTNAAYTYDETVYTMTVTVTKEGGSLRYTRTITRPGGVGVVESTFTSVYTKPAGTTAPGSPGMHDPNQDESEAGQDENDTGQDDGNSDPGDNNTNPDGDIDKKPAPDKPDNNAGDAGDIEWVSKSNRAKAPRTADPAIFWIWVAGLAVGATGAVGSRRRRRRRKKTE